MSRDGTLPPGVEHWNIEDAQEPEWAICYGCDQPVTHDDATWMTVLEPGERASYGDGKSVPICPACRNQDAREDEMADKIDPKDMAYPQFWLGAFDRLSDDIQSQADESRIKADTMPGEMGRLVCRAKAAAYQDAENRVRAVMDRLASEAGVDMERLRTEFGVEP